MLFVSTARIFKPKDWAHFDMAAGVNDTGEQEVLDIKIIHDDDLAVPVHNRFWKAGISS